jgi:hypothetical protein
LQRAQGVAGEQPVEKRFAAVANYRSGEIIAPESGGANMKQLGVGALAVLIAFGVSALAAQSEPAVTSEAPHMAVLSGKLAKIEGKTITVEETVEGKAKETAIDCEEAHVFKAITAAAAGAPAGEKEKATPRRRLSLAEFDDLKVGQQVRVYYNTQDNKARGVTITADVSAGGPASGAQEK